MLVLDYFGVGLNIMMLGGLAIALGEVVDELGTTGDFIGHAGGDNYVVITTNEAADALKRRLKERFGAEIQTHYNFIDRQQGFIQAPKPDGEMVKVPLMTLSIGIVSPARQSFSDIREITELAAEARRQDSIAPAGA